MGGGSWGLAGFTGLKIFNIVCCIYIYMYVESLIYVCLCIYIYMYIEYVCLFAVGLVVGFLMSGSKAELSATAAKRCCATVSRGQDSLPQLPVRRIIVPLVKMAVLVMMVCHG